MATDYAGLKAVRRAEWWFPEARSGVMHQLVADELRRAPAPRGQVVAWIAQRLADPGYWIHFQDALQELDRNDRS